MKKVTITYLVDEDVDVSTVHTAAMTSLRHEPGSISAMVANAPMETFEFHGTWQYMAQGHDRKKVRKELAEILENIFFEWKIEGES